MARLDDLRPLIGEPITGAIAANVVTSETGGHQRADLRVEGRDIGLAGAASTGPVELTTTIVDPLTHPVLDTRVVAAKLASGIGASVQIDSPDRKTRSGSKPTRKSATRSGDLRLATTGTVNAETRVAALSTCKRPGRAKTCIFWGRPASGLAMV